MSILPMTGWRMAWRVLLSCFVLAGLAIAAIALEQPAGHLTGVVLDQRGKPLARAKVIAAGRVTRSAFTQADGRFRFSHVPIGDYYVSARARGHEPQHQEDYLTVKEGETLAEVDFKLARTSPSIDVANVQRVFLPGRPVRINTRGNQLDSLDVALFRLNLGPLLREDSRLLTLRGTTDPVALQRRGVVVPLKSWQLPVRRAESSDDDWFFQPVQVDDLPPGNYLVSVGGQPGPDPDGKARPRVRDTWWFQVSQTAVVTKRTQATLLAWVTDLQTKTPTPGAKVQLFWPGHVRTGMTDAQGLVRFVLPAGTEAVTVTAEHRGSWALAQAGYWGDPRKLDIYAYTERPLYRRGQTVHLKALVRRRSGRGFQLAAGLPLRAVLRDARGDIVAERRVVASSYSSCQVDFPLSREASLGEYRAELTTGDAYQSVAFQVADYRKPEYKVEVLPLQPRWVMGETARVKVRSAYFFGAPVVGARLNATVYSAPAWGEPPDDSESFFAGFTGSGGETYWGLGDVVMQLEARTDERGELEFDVPLPPAVTASSETPQGDRIFTVVLEALDDSGRPVKSQGSFRVVQSDLRVQIKTDRVLHLPGQPVTLELILKNQTAERQTGRVSVRVYRLEQATKRSEQGDEYYEMRRVPVFSRSVVTDGRGSARLKIPSLPTGHYELLAEAKDSRGRLAQERAVAWVASEEEGGRTYRAGGLEMVLDKATYRPGERARVLLIAPEPNMRVLLTEEGRDILRPRVLHLRGTTAVFDVMVSDAHQPNMWLGATVVNGLELLTAERSLNVLPEEKFLKLSVTSDVERAQPGQTVNYTITARDWQGQPVDAEVSLGIVDEAIYALEPDRTPDIRGFFHGPRWNLVEMAFSFAEDYSGGLDKFAPDPRVRAQFKDTAAWFPALRTGAEGTVTVSVDLPDNLTTWVATAHAATVDTRVGSHSQRLVATKDVLLRLEPPRFLVAGDRVDLVAIAHNYSENPLEAEVTLQAKGLEVKRPGPQRVKLAPGGLARVVWRAETSEPGEVQLTSMLKVHGADVPGDAVQLSLPVVPRGVEDFSPLALYASQNEPASAVLMLPPTALSGARLVAQLHTTPLGAIESAMSHLLDYPYGCAEQTLARCAPASVLLPRLQREALPDEWLRAWQARATQGLAGHFQRLCSMQQLDGGWGWWTQDVSRPELTAYVLLHLAEARDAGIPLPARVIEAARRKVLEDLSQTKRHASDATRVRRFAGPDLRAQALLALGRWQKPPRGEVERLWAERAALSPQARAQFVLALLEAGETARAQEALRGLKTLMVETETYGHWRAGTRATWHDSPTEATAWALRALLRFEPQSPQVLKAARWLMSKNSRGAWEHTRATTAAAWALTEWLRASPGRAAKEGVATLLLNQQAVASWVQAPGERTAVPPVWQIPLGTGPQEVQLNVTASGPLSWDLSGGAVYDLEARGLAAQSDNGVAVERTYYRLSAQDMARVQGKGLTALFSPDRARALTPLVGDAHPGERILVKLTLKASQALRWMCLVDPLPAGCEVLDTVQADWSFWWSHQESRDTEMAFFFSELPGGERSVFYVMRPTVTGRYTALPSRVWAMYDPEVRARGIHSVFGIAE